MQLAGYRAFLPSPLPPDPPLDLGGNAPNHFVPG